LRCTGGPLPDIGPRGHSSFTQVRGRGDLRTSGVGGSRKFTPLRTLLVLR
jgi:hypothetical protein